MIKEISRFSSKHRRLLFLFLLRICSNLTHKRLNRLCLFRRRSIFVVGVVYGQYSHVGCTNPAAQLFFDDIYFKVFPFQVTHSTMTIILDILMQAVLAIEKNLLFLHKGLCGFEQIALVDFFYEDFQICHF